jgi:alkylhydroperoxidase/carboxymuconolactone decarboxylase family protein YurZ
MNIGYLTALSALAGSVVGGMTTGFTTWLSLRSQARAGRLAGELMRRQDLFKDFIVAASKAWGEALFTTEPKIQDLIALYAMVSRMRVLCSPEVVSRADNVMRSTIDTYFMPNKTVRELHDLIKSGTAIDPLKEFSEAAREELGSFAPL